MNTLLLRKPEEASPRSASKGITIHLPKLPQLSMHAIVLALVLIVAIVQSIQLFELKRALSEDALSAAVPPTSSASPLPSSGALPEMVGGC